MTDRTEFLLEWRQRAKQAGLRVELSNLGTNVIRGIYEKRRFSTSEQQESGLREACEAMIRFATEQPEQARTLWKSILTEQRNDQLPEAFFGVDAHELLQYVPFDYPWDRWEKKALAAGMPKSLASLGRSLMREAVQHSWDTRLQRECGWADNGAAMLRFALNRPDEARRRWDFLMETDGDRYFGE